VLFNLGSGSRLTQTNGNTAHYVAILWCVNNGWPMVQLADITIPTGHVVLSPLAYGLLLDRYVKKLFILCILGHGYI